MWALSAGIALSAQLGEPWRPQTRPRRNIRNPLTSSYQTKDGRWLYLSCLQGFRYWPEACRVIGRPDLIEDERFATAQALSDNVLEAVKILDAVFASATLGEWRDRLRDFSGQWAPVQDSIEIMSDEQVTANGYVLEAEAKDGTRFPLVTTPVQFGGEPSPPRRAPEFNEHGDDILTGELGLDWDTVVELKVKGVVA